jgi:hypothetical protein
MSECGPVEEGVAVLLGVGGRIEAPPPVGGGA